ncbi:MAG: restriction endonuclease subunit S [Verrucomicrobiia bacterium]
MSESNGQKLPPGWTEAKIEDIFAPLDDGRTLHQGWSPQCEKTPSTSDAEWGVLKTTAIQAGSFLPEHNKRLPKGLTPRPQIEVKPGDILITCAGPRVRCGVACLVRSTRPRLMMSGKMYRFRAAKQIEPRFVETYLRTHWAAAAIDKMKTGGSDSGLNLTHDRFRLLPIPVAPLNEQRRIMDTLEELLSDLDAGVSALERVQQKLAHYRAAVLKAAVEGALTAEWRKQHLNIEPASVLLTRILAERRRRWEQDQLRKFKAAGKEPPKNWKAKYKEPLAPNTTDLPSLPKGWCWVSLDQLTEESSIGIDRGLQYQTPSQPGSPYIKMNNVTMDGRVIADDLVYVRTTEDEQKRYTLREGDLLFNTRNSKELVGKVGLVRSIPTNAVYNNNLMRLRFPDGISSRFVSFQMCSGNFRKRMEVVKRATTSVAAIYAKDLFPLQLALPASDEQEAIVEAVEDQLSVIEHIESDVEAKLKTAQSLRQSILRHAFTGQLVPQDPNDEPASELLRRIAAERKERARQAIAAKRANKKPKRPRRAPAVPRKRKTTHGRIANR